MSSSSSAKKASAASEMVVDGVVNDDTVAVPQVPVIRIPVKMCERVVKSEQERVDALAAQTEYLAMTAELTAEMRNVSVETLDEAYSINEVDAGYVRNADADKALPESIPLPLAIRKPLTQRVLANNRAIAKRIEYEEIVLGLAAETSGLTVDAVRAQYEFNPEVGFVPRG